MTISDLKSHLIGLSHGGTLNKVRNIAYLFERAGNNMLTKIRPLSTMRTVALSNTIYDDIYNYALPSDYRSIIDLYPQDNRNSDDKSKRLFSEGFDLGKQLTSKNLSIESENGTKLIRLNWRTNAPIVLHTMNSLTDNGTWSAVGTATGLKAQTLYKVSGNASIEFDVAASGDGIQNTTITDIDLSTQDEVADAFYWVYLGSDYANLTSINFIFGSDLTANYWTAVAQTTQADGTSFRNGWNLIKSPWTTATESGTVAPATIDSCKITFTTTGTLSNVRIDNITFAVGRNFDIKYYSKYFIKNSAGTWIGRTTSDNDSVVFDDDEVNIYIYECLLEMAHQVEGEDSSFDMNFALRKLNGNPDSLDPVERMGLYAKYRAEHPAQNKKATTSYGSYRNPNLR